MLTKLAIALVLALCGSLSAQAYLLKDINTEVTEDDSWPNYLTVNGSNVFFTARLGGLAPLLPWVSDGTANGTLLLQEMTTSTSASAQGVAAFGSGVVFSAGDPAHGRELWVSDGTVAGTQMVVDLNSGTADGASPILAVVNGLIVFRGNNGSTGFELFVSDGTASGTTLLVDIVSGTGSGNPLNFVVAGNKLFFTATTAATGTELWVTDGTTSGTALCKDINSGSASSGITEMAAVGNEVYFSAFDTTGGIEPWKSDGTSGGTVMIADIETGASGHSNPSGFSALSNGDVVFAATTASAGKELWITDGTSAGTQLIVDLRSGTASSNPSHLFSMGGYVLCAADDGTTAYDELWRTDGTAGGTTLVKDINLSPNTGSDPRFFVQLGAVSLFYAVGGTGATGLWKTDGTTAGTVLVRDVEVNSAAVKPMVAGSSLAFFAGQAFGTNNGVELWRSDGTNAGTWEVKNIWMDAEGSSPQTFTDLNGVTVFWATDQTNGREPWVTDGTTAGTQLLGDILPGQGSNFVSRVVPYAGIGFFTADNGTQGRELWATDGTPAGTALFLDIYSGAGSSAPDDFIEMGGLLYFTAADATNGRELWVTNGTVGGTQLVADMRPGNQGSAPDDVTVFANELYFSADTPTGGRELWKSDGTTAGTGLIRDISPTTSSIPQSFMEINGELLFSADDGTNGRELWITDGTTAGTVMLLHINTGSASANPTWLASVGGYAFFRATEAATGTELWRTDGTVSGTIRLADATSGAGSGSAGFKGVYQNKLVYTASSAAAGSEPWMSDGTVAGTAMLLDVNPGTPNSGCTWLGVTAAGFVFAATHATYGSEVWVSDGTTAGTSMLADIYSGPLNGAGLYYVGEQGGEAYFNGRTPGSGAALWKTDGTTAGTVLVDEIVAGAASGVASHLQTTGTMLLLLVPTVAYGSEPWVFDTTPASQAPVVTLASSSTSYTENAAATQVAAGATLTDGDSTDFDGGYLRLEIVQAASADDRITIPNQGTGAGQVGVAGTTVSFGGTAIGTLSGGTGATPLIVTFNAASSSVAAQALLRAIEFEVLGENPTAATRVVEVTAHDGDGGFSTPQQVSVSVTPVNDLPVLHLPTSGTTNFSGNPGGPFTATLQPTTPQMPNMRLEVSDPDSTPTLSNVSVAPFAPASMTPPTAPQTTPNGTVLDWTGNTANSLPGTYSWTLTFSDVTGGPVTVLVSITIPDIAPQHTNGADSSGSGTLAQPYFTNSYVGTQPSRHVVTANDPCLLHSTSIQNVTAAASNPTGVWTISMTAGTGPRSMFATPGAVLSTADLGAHDFTVVLTDGALTTTIEIRVVVYSASGAPPDINVPSGSQFVKNSSGPTTTLTLTVDPSTSLAGIASLELVDPTGDDVEISSVTPPSIPMASVALSYTVGLHASPYVFQFTGQVESFDPIGPNRWDLVVEDQYGNSDQFEVYIVVNNLAPTTTAGPDAVSGSGVSTAPFAAIGAYGSSLSLEVVQIVDANSAEPHTVTLATPSVSNPASGANIQFVVNPSTHRIEAYTTTAVQPSEVGTYVYEIEFADYMNYVTVWVQIDIGAPPPGGGGSGGDSGGGEDSGCSTRSQHGCWHLLTLAAICLLAALRLARRRELG